MLLQPAIVLLREAVEWGWKPKLARDVAAMVDDSSDGEGQQMVECEKRRGWLIALLAEDEEENEEEDEEEEADDADDADSSRQPRRGR